MDKEKVTKNLGIHSLFKSISNSFISLFVPLIIYNQLGYKMAILYLIVFSLCAGLVPIIMQKLIKKQPVTAICVHIVVAIGAYLIIALSRITVPVLLLVAMLTGIGDGLYYSSITAIISSNKSSKGFSSFKVWQYFGAFIMVLFNGYVLNLGASFSVLVTCGVSLLLYIISIIPFFTVINHINLIGSENVQFRTLVVKTHKHNLFTAFFGLEDMIMAHVVPLYLAISNLSVDKIAIIVAIINFSKMMITIVANKLYKQKLSFLAIMIGSVLFGVSCLVMAVSGNKILLYIMSVLGGLVFPFFYIPTLNEFQKDIEGAYAEGMIIREVSVHCLRSFLLLPFIFITNLSWMVALGIIVAVGLAFTGYRIFQNS